MKTNTCRKVRGLRNLCISCLLVLFLAAEAVAFAAPLNVDAAAVDYHSIFDASFYAAAYPEVAAVYGTHEFALYRHYSGTGIKEGRAPSAIFNPVYYRQNYPDLAAAFGDDWTAYARHFVTNGRIEGRVADRLLSESGAPAPMSAEERAALAVTPVTYNAAPANPNAYIVTSDLTQIADLKLGFQKIGGGDLVFPNAAVYPGSTVKLYFDGTILVAAWKEVVNNHLCNFAEVITCDGSQFRRKITGDTFGSPIKQPLTELSALTQAVVAANADYYMARGFGTSVYDGHVYRFNAMLDTCFVTYDGEMLLSYAGQFHNIAECQSFVDSNNVNFALTFGPIIIDHGQIREIEDYRLGEINESYSRASLGCFEPNHYLLMTLGFEYGYRSGLLSDEAKIMAAKGCEKAYALDGGGTGQIVVNSQIYSLTDFREEREVSDMIYFTSYGN